MSAGRADCRDLLYTKISRADPMEPRRDVNRWKRSASIALSTVLRTDCLRWWRRTREGGGGINAIFFFIVTIATHLCLKYNYTIHSRFPPPSLKSVHTSPKNTFLGVGDSKPSSKGTAASSLSFIHSFIEMKANDEAAISATFRSSRGINAAMEETRAVTSCRRLMERIIVIIGPSYAALAASQAQRLKPVRKPDNN